jgi:CHRD domain
MRRRYALFALALAFTAPGCDDDNPTGPSNSGPIVFTSSLSTQNEVPALANSAEASCTGSVTITFSVPRDGSGTVTGPGTVNFSAPISNCPSGTPLNLAHIHRGAPGVAGPFVVNTGLTAANPVLLTNGSGTINVSGVAITQALAQEITDNPGGFYFNAHSSLNPSGVVRGQLTRAQ